MDSVCSFEHRLREWTSLIKFLVLVLRPVPSHRSHSRFLPILLPYAGVEDVTGS